MSHRSHRPRRRRRARSGAGTVSSPRDANGSARTRNRAPTTTASASMRDAVAELDGGDVPVVPGDDAPDALVDDVHPGRAEGIELGVTRRHALVQHDRQLRRQLTEQRRRMEARRVGDDLHDASIADLVAVAERAVDDIATPVLGDPGDVRELVDQPGRGEHPPGHHRVPAGELDAEASVGGPGDVDGVAGDHLDAVAADLLATDRGQRRRRAALRDRGSCACGRPARCGARPSR